MNQHKITIIKGVLGAFFFVNLQAVTAFLDKNISVMEKLVSIIDVIIAIAAIYFAFKLNSLLQNHPKIVQNTIWFGLLLNLASVIWIRLLVIWFIFYAVISIYLLVTIKGALKETNPVPTSLNT